MATLLRRRVPSRLLLLLPHRRPVGRRKAPAPTAEQRPAKPEPRTEAQQVREPDSQQGHHQRHSRLELPTEEACRRDTPTAATRQRMQVRTHRTR